MQPLVDVTYEVNDITKYRGAELGIGVSVLKALDLGLERGRDTTLRAAESGG